MTNELSQEEQDLILQDVNELTWGTNQEWEETTQTDEASTGSEETQAEETQTDEASNEWETKADKVKKLLAQRNSEKKEKEELAERVKQLEAQNEQQNLDNFKSKYPNAEKVMDKIEEKMQSVPWLSREEAYVLVWWTRKTTSWTNMGGLNNSITAPTKTANEMDMDELSSRAWQEIEKQLLENWIY